MRLLFAVGSIDPSLGGSVEATRLLAAGAKAEGHHVEVLAADTPRPEWLDIWPCPVHHCGRAPGIFRFTSRLVPWIRANASRFDAVVIAGVWTWLGYGVRKGLIFTHGMLDRWLDESSPWKIFRKKIFWRLVESRNLQAAAAVLFTGEVERAGAAHWFAGHPPRSFLSPLGIEGPPPDAGAQIDAFQKAFPTLASARYLLYLGRIAQGKGCDMLLAAFAGIAPSHPELQLVFAGPAPDPGYLAKLKQMAGEFSGRVHWIGRVSGDIKWGAMRLADAFVLPSHGENFGISAVEAMSCVVPVLLSNRVPIHREVESCEAGFVEQDDLAGTLRLLERWLNAPARQQRRMAENAFRCFQTCFEYRSAARSLIQILRDQCVAAGPQPVPQTGGPPVGIRTP